MKIIFFIDSFPAGGKERRLLELMKGLRTRSGIEFELAIMSNDVHYKEIFDLDIKVHFVIRKTKKDISVFSKFYHICKNFRPDIVHCWDSMTAVYLVPVSKLLRIKLVNGMVADTPEQQNIRNKTWLRGKLTFPFSHIIIGNSLAGLAAYGAPERKAICIYNGFDFKRTENLSNPALMKRELGIHTKFVVGMVASFSVYKDYRTYYSAAELLLEKRKDITFLAIGDHTDSADSKKLITDEYADHFRLLGRKSGIESFVSIMDVCVLATFTEGISNSILEYMAMSKPVVATDGGGTSEILKEGETGFLVNAAKPVELAEKIEKLLNNEELRMKMGKAGNERVKNDFSIDSMIERYIFHYSKLLKSKVVN
jgi:glycosyltransferase involved in cell wall biosynthesis